MEQIDHNQIEQQAQEAEAAAAQVLEHAQDFTVQTDEEYSRAGDELKAIKDRKRELEEQKKAITKPLNDALKQVRALFSRPEEFLADAERVLKKAMLGYQEECDRKRREEQRAAEEAARKERERLAKRAEKAAEKGQDDKAAELEQQAATTTAPVIHREPPKVTGTSTREIWKAEVTDLEALVKAVAEGRASIALLQANTKEIGQRARAMKSEFQVDGIRVWPEKVMAA